MYNIFLIGSGLNIFYGAVGALVVGWLREGDWLKSLVVATILVVGSLVLWQFAKRSAC